MILKAKFYKLKYMSENINIDKENENNKNNIEELNYSFSAFNNSSQKDINNNKNIITKLPCDNKISFSNSNNKIKKERVSKKSLTKGKILGGQFILGEEIGKGTFGVVRIATHIITGEKVAVKMFDKDKISSDESEKKRLEKEIKIIKVIRHRNIVQLYNVFQTSSTIFIVMEHIHGKELFEIIVKKKKLSELESLFYFQQLISGIEYLGKIGIAHRDLKPENLLIDSKKVLKIADFGLSNIYKKNELLSTPCGSPSYAAPEMLSGNKYNGLNADIWSCGIILYTMLCGRLPFEDKDNEKLYEKIKQGSFIVPEFLSENCKDFIKKILNVDPNKRYNITQIKKHPWFNQLDQNKYMSKGLLIYKYIVPIDEEIVEKMKSEYEYNEKEVRMNILANKHNHITTTYYLFLKQKIRKGKHSVADMVHSEFINYIHNPKNFLANYNGDWNKLFKERANKIYSSDKGSYYSKRASKKIDMNDNEKLKNNIFKDDNKYLYDDSKDNNNEFKEKIEEIYKRKNSKINDDINNNNNKIVEKNNKGETETKNKIQMIKTNLNMKNIEKKENLITINLEETKPKPNKNTNNFTPFYSKKSNYSYTNNYKNYKIKINTNKTISNHYSEIQKNKHKSEIIKKPIAPIPKFKAQYQNKIKEDNKKKIKRKTISIHIKNISIETKENKNNSKTKKFLSTFSYVNTKNNINKKPKNNSMQKISNFTNKDIKVEYKIKK